MTYTLYALIQNKKAIYIGVTKRYNDRVKEHRKTKVFDNPIVIKKYKNKKLAYNAENAILTYLAYFGNHLILNKFDVNVRAKKLYL